MGPCLELALAQRGQVVLLAVDIICCQGVARREEHTRVSDGVSTETDPMVSRAHYAAAPSGREQKRKTTRLTGKLDTREDG